MNTIANQNEQQTAVRQVPTTSSASFVSPEVNIYETLDGYVLEAEMPGVNKSGLNISVEANTLTIEGRRQKTELKAESLYRETSEEDYRRVFELDPAIDTARIEAKLEQGVLTVRLPKVERVKPRKISVTG
jgi:HSP20 family protein